MVEVDLRRRLLAVAPYSQRGGSELYLEMLLPRLVHRFSIEVVALQNGPLTVALQRQGFPVDVLPTGPAARHLVRSGLTLRRTLRRLRPDVILANGLKAALVAIVACKPGRLPVVWIKHDFGWDGVAARTAGHACASIVGVSHAVTRTFGARMRRKIRVVHNGLPPLDVDAAAGRARLRALLDAPEDSSIVTLVGRMNPVKGHLELIDVAGLVAERHPGTRFALIGGEDPTAPVHLERVRAALQADVPVTWLGHREDARELMAGSDVTAMPSVPDDRGLIPEASPFVALEAMALGVPLVAYDVGGIRETVGECARLVEMGDRPALAHALAELLSDEAARRALSSCGRRRSKEKFSVDRMAAETGDVLEEAVRS